MKLRVKMHLILLSLLGFLGFTHSQGVVTLTKEKCVNSGILILNCQPGSVIRIRQIVLGDSTCYGRYCCPKTSDCTYQPSDGHKNQVNNACNGQSSCSVAVEQKSIPCGTFGIWQNNDFERIKYECTATTTSSSSSSPSLPTSVTTTAAVATTTTTTTSETTTLSLLVVNRTTTTTVPSVNDNDNNDNNDTAPVTAVDAVTLIDEDTSEHNSDRRTDDAAADDDGEDGVVSVIIPIIVAIIVLVVIAVIVGYCVIRRKRLAESKESQGFSNPEYAAMNFRHLEQSQSQTDSSDVTASPIGPPSPIYELESAIGRLSDAPLIPENEYSDVEDVKRGAKFDAPAGKKPASACSDYCVPAECGLRPGDAPSYDSPVSPAAQYQPGSPSPIYGNVDIEMQPCNAAGIYSEPKPWSEVAYESVGMRQQHPESEYVPYTANEEPRVSLHPTAANGQLNNNSVYFNMGRQQSTEVSP